MLSFVAVMAAATLAVQRRYYVCSRRGCMCVCVCVCVCVFVVGERHAAAARDRAVTAVTDGITAAVEVASGAVGEMYAAAATGNAD